MGSFLYGIIGLMVGAVSVYLLLKRKLAKLQQRLQRSEKALEQTEASNRQQATQLKKFREAQPQTHNLEQYYQDKVRELEQSYQERLQKLEQYQTPSDGAHQAEIERLQAEHQQTVKELETRYQSRLAELERAHQLQLEGLRQSPGIADESFATTPALSDEPDWKKTEAYWSGEESSLDSAIVNPFLTEASEKVSQSSDVGGAEFDLAALIEPEGDASVESRDTWKSPSRQLQKPPQESSLGANFDLFEVLETETPAALPEMPDNNSKDDDVLPDLFSGSESDESDLQEFLSMLESEGDLEDQNGRVSSDRSKISFS